MDEIKVKDMINGKSGFISVNFTKLKENIKKCKEQGDNRACKIAMEQIGVEWLDE